MSTAKHSRTAACFFWIGLAMSAACLVVVLARDNKFLWRFEHGDFPLSGAFAGVAALAFLATELSDSLHRPRAAKDPSLPPILLEDEDKKL